MLLKNILCGRYIFLFALLPLTSTLSQNNLTRKDYNSPDKYIIADIQVLGVKQFSPATIISYTGLTKGEEIEIPSDRFGKIIDKLWSQDLFGKVDIYSYKVLGDSVYLMIELNELPLIAGIKYTGVDDEEELRPKVTVRSGDRFSKSMSTDIQRDIKKYYEGEGYYFATSQVEVKESMKVKGAVDLEIKVDEGEEIEINEIIFRGVEQLDPSDIKDEMEKTLEDKWWRWFSDSRLVKKDFEEDKKKIIAFYRANGFRDARIERDSVYLFDSENLNVIIDITEGAKYHYKNIDWKGNELYPSELLSKVLQIDQGDVYDATLLNERLMGSQDGDDVRTLYMDRGYLFANITPLERQVAGDSISLEILVYEGQPARVDRVTFSGNTVTKDEIVLRTIRTRPGDLFSKTAIQRTFRELAQLSFFDPEKIGVDPAPKPATNTVDIHYTLSEKSTSQVQLQGGWGGGGLFGSVGLSFGNFATSGIFDADEWTPIPRGDGQKLSLNYQQGVFYNTTSLSFTEPYLTKGYKPYSLTTSLYYTHRSFTQRTGFSTLQSDDNRYLTIAGLDVGITKGLTFPDDYFYVGAQVSYQRYTMQDYPISLFDFSTGVSNNLSYTLSLNRNSSGPNPIYPTTGSIFSMKGKFTFPYSLFRDDLSSLTSAQKLSWLEFYKLTFKADWYTTIWDKMVFRFNTQLGYLGAYDYRVGIVPFERFYVGGTGLVQAFRDAREVIPLRGYNDNSLSDIYGSTAFTKFSLELRYPITLKPTASIYVLSFVETGNGKREGVGNLSLFDTRRSAGFGVRIFLPFFGMLGFDMGYGFDPAFGQQGPSGWNTHFILGQQF